ncbi:MAG: hypothetical protein GX271_04940 [Clostridiales bacterium]|nr:hypothetical protein [Clostridiales bacterium]
MKKCGKCGAIQNNKRFYCIDCNERLGPPLTDEEEKKETAVIRENINTLSNKVDYFYVSKLDRITIILLLIFSTLHLLLMIIRSEYYRENHLFGLGIILIILAVSTSVSLRYPELTWELHKLRYIFVFDNINDLEPSRQMLWSRRFFSKLILAIVVIAFVAILLQY